ncbi:MAG: metallophosphoesterase [Candidatus Melainabacteria bacterium]|nr:metallophosphoesterase [Candidatus Melainabacteria bacterium]
MAAPYPYQIQRLSVPVLNWPVALDGLTVLHISDIHLDHYLLPHVNAFVETFSALAPDLVCCTGDVVTIGNKHLTALEAMMAAIPAKLGRFACLGNHDYDDHAHSQAVRAMWQAAGYRLLVNQSVQLNAEAPCYVAGVDDLKHGQPDLQATFQQIPPDSACILLAHNPKNYPELARYQPSLILCGHTHGGQNQLFSPVCRLTFGPYYDGGLYTDHASPLYLNSGLGTATLPIGWGRWRYALPVPRYKTQAEVALLSLSSTDSAKPNEQPTGLGIA